MESSINMMFYTVAILSLSAFTFMIGSWCLVGIRAAWELLIGVDK